MGCDVFMDKKRFDFKLNSKPEKIISTVALSVTGAILFDGSEKKVKNPKKHKNFIQRIKRNYKIVDTVLSKTIAKDLQKNLQNNYKSETLKNLRIEKGEFIDI